VIDCNNARRKTEIKYHVIVIFASYNAVCGFRASRNV